MLKRRDRHQRGLRGPLAQPNPLTGTVVPLRGRAGKAEFFLSCLEQAVHRIGEQCPQALARIDVGVEDVPSPEASWASRQVPLAAAVAATAERHGQIVIYRRPLEHRAATRKGLRILVYRTIVQQLAAITGYSVDDIDPKGLSRDDDWD